VPAEQRAVTYEQGKALADEFGVAFFETSAKENIKVEDAFMSITNDIVARLEEADAPVAAGGVSVGGGGDKMRFPAASESAEIGVSDSDCARATSSCARDEQNALFYQVNKFI
jgi:Ras-related protein Rab-8A